MKTSFLLCFLAGIILLSSCRKGEEENKPVRKNITQAVYASGKIYPVNDYKVYSKLPGYIEKILVRVGDTVTTGQPLLVIKSEQSTLSVESAKNLYELAVKNAGENSALLSALKQDVASARSKYTLDSANAVRMKNLADQDAVSKLAFEQAITQADVSKQNYLKALNNFLGSRDRLRTEAENAKVQYEAQSAGKSDYTLISAVSGKVYDIVPREGELINTQFPVMEIGDAGNYEVELNVDETDISFLKTGQEVLYTTDAFGEKIFRGKIKEVYPRINQMNKTSKIMGTISVEPGTKIYSGMSVEGNIIIARRSGALVINREYLRDGKFVKVNGEEKLREIKTGVSDLQYVEVVSGLTGNEELEKP